MLLQVDERGAWPHEKTAGGRSHGVFLSPVLSRLVVPAGRERKGEEAGGERGCRTMPCLRNADQNPPAAVHRKQNIIVTALLPLATRAVYPNC